MQFFAMMALSAFLLFPTGEDAKNPWRDKVGPAVEKAHQSATPAAYLEALDAAWRGDDWQAGLKLASEVAEKFPDDATLFGSTVRALWRGGRLAEAEKLAARIKPDTEDHIALTQLVQISAARGQHELAETFGDRIEKLGPKTATELAAIFGPRLQAGRAKNMADIVRRIAALADAKNGYPDTFTVESIDGLADFFAAIGDEPLNQIVGYGSAPMPLVQGLGLPGVDAMINGKGPYRFIVDTGGSILLSLDTEIAEEAGIKPMAPSSVRGVGGKQSAGQTLVDDFHIGGIRMKRVSTRIWDFPPPMKATVGGVIGTGIFAKGRMTLDFIDAKLTIVESSEKPAGGKEVELRLVSDAKLITPIKMAGGPAIAVLDSGASTAAISPAKVQQLFPDRKVHGMKAALMGAGEGGPSSISLTPGVDVELLGKTYPAMGLVGLDMLDETLSPALGVQIQMLGGMPQIREMKSWTIDFHRCRMWVD